MMPDPRKCCLLGICCDPPAQIAALTAQMVSGGMDAETAARAAEILAPKLRTAVRGARASAAR